MRFILVLLLTSLCPALHAQSSAAAGAKSEPLKRTISLTLQSGFADTFQLTLGGTFGDGPAWQSKVTITAGEVFRKGDAVIVSGWKTHDTPSHSNDWLAGISYRSRIVANNRHSLFLSAGLQRWRFPSVLTGAQDWVGAWQLQYLTRVKRTPIMLTQEAWTLFHSPLRKGSLLFTQLYTEHPIKSGDGWKLALRHGPQHTHSWDFYDRDGKRVVRYAGFLLLTYKKAVFEAGYRQQVGLQKRIPHNRYWHAMVSRTF